MKYIILALCAVSLVGCSKEIKVVCTGTEEVETDGKVTQTLPKEISVAMSSAGKTPGGGLDAYKVLIGTDRLDDGFGHNGSITASNSGLPGIKMAYNQATNAIKVEEWNRGIGDTVQSGIPYILKTFTGVCK